MSFPEPKFSRSQVQRAGATLIENNVDGENLFVWLEAFSVLANWRACHGYPINTFQATLRTKLKKVDKTALVAQRLKRTPSILRKLERFPGMNLARMQDIGGLRAVVSTLPQLRRLYSNYLNTRFTHTLVNTTDYVNAPKASGYRSIHLVYRYKLARSSPYDGLQLELQMRTKLQHAWATAVETVGTFLQHSLKSSEGPQDWLNFFALVSSAFAHMEKTPLVPNYEDLDREQTFKMVRDEATRLGVREMLIGYSSAVKAIPPGTSRGAYYLIELELEGDSKNVSIRPFAKDRLEEANTEYARAEQAVKEGKPVQVVLVSAGSIESLKKAYPNYFLDTHQFLNHLQKIEKTVIHGDT